MIKKLAVALVLISGTIHAQNCYRTGNFMNGDGETVKGTANLTLNSSNKLDLSFSSDFSSSAGPDLDVYLSSEMRVNSKSINIKALTSLSGAQSYVIPDSINIGDYKYIVIHCTQYNHFYGYAMLGDNVGDCSTLKVGSVNSAPEFKFYVNNGTFHIDSPLDYSNVTFSIYTINGQLINSEYLSVLSKGNNSFVLENKGNFVAVLNHSQWNTSKLLLN